jgi:hypothetical protein
MKVTMNILLITGKTASGKSTFLEKRSNCHVIDPLGPGFTEWCEPTGFCEVVAFDHVHSLSNAKKDLTAAYASCEANKKPLWLLENSRKDIESCGFEFDRRTVELQLFSENGGQKWQFIVEGEIMAPTPYFFGKLTGYGLEGRTSKILPTPELALNA